MNATRRHVLRAPSKHVPKTERSIGHRANVFRKSKQETCFPGKGNSLSSKASAVSTKRNTDHAPTGPRPRRGVSLERAPRARPERAQSAPRARPEHAPSAGWRFAGWKKDLEEEKLFSNLRNTIQHSGRALGALWARSGRARGALLGTGPSGPGQRLHAAFLYTK